MRRKIESDITAWLKSESHCPLFIKGPRRVGKTYLVKTYLGTVVGTSHVAYFDFQTDLSTMEEIFAGRTDVDRIAADLEIYLGRKLDPAADILVFDEVQLSEKALNSLRFFAQSEWRVIATGSLLGVTLNKYRMDGSRRLPYPSDVRHLSMHPMDFEEFLWALGRDDVAAGIRRCYQEDRPYLLHKEAMELYRSYLVVGGMPLAVSSFAETRSLEPVRLVLKEIDETYIADMPGMQSALCRAIWDSIPGQLARESTRKFKYADVVRGGRAQKFEDPLCWLEGAGVVTLNRQTNSCELPLVPREGGAFFKVYMADTGLMFSKYGLSPELVFSQRSYETLSAAFRGALAENYVMQQLAAREIPTFYWTPGDASGEIEFVTGTPQGDVLPIEVKSGDNVRSRSLKAYMERTGCPLGIRISGWQFGHEGRLKSIPLYAAFCIEVQSG